MSELINFYGSLLKAIDCTVNDDGTILGPVTGNPITVKLNKIEKKLVLPTAEVLKNGDWDSVVAFHPAAESIIHGQSEVLNAYLTFASLKLHDSVQMAVASIISLGLNKDAKNKLTNKQMDLLGQFECIDTSVEKALLDIAKKNTGISGKYPLLSLRLDRAGEIDGEIYSRTCTLRAPILNSTESFCGVTPTNATARKVIHALYTYVFPEKLVYGSNSKNTPYLCALLECYYHTAVHLNNIRLILGKYTTMKPIHIAWYDDLKSVSKMAKRDLPQTLPGNKGVRLKDDNALEEDESTPTPNDTTGRPSIYKKFAAQQETTSTGLVKLAEVPKPTISPNYTAPPPPPVPFTPPYQPAVQNLTTAQRLAAYTQSQAPVQTGYYPAPAPYNQQVYQPCYPQGQHMQLYRSEPLIGRNDVMSGNVGYSHASGGYPQQTPGNGYYR